MAEANYGLDMVALSNANGNLVQENQGLQEKLCAANQSVVHLRAELASLSEKYDHILRDYKASSTRVKTLNDQVEILQQQQNFETQVNSQGVSTNAALLPAANSLGPFNWDQQSHFGEYSSQPGFMPAQWNQQEQQVSSAEFSYYKI